MSESAHAQQIWLKQIGSNGIQAKIPELLYYRGKTALLDLAPKLTNQAKLAGNYLAKSKGRGMEFDEVRHYQTGDDPRMIDWRVTARTGKAHTKLFREEKERPIFILTDLSQTMQFGSQLLYKSVQASHLSALIAWRAKKRGDRIGGIVFNNQLHRELKPKTRQTGVLQYLHALDMLSAPSIEAEQNKHAFADACARLRRLAKPGSLVCLISDFRQLDDTAIKHLTQLSRHCELKAYRITDPLELALPQVNTIQTLLVQDGEHQGQLIVGDRTHQQRYQAEAAQFKLQQDKLLASVKCRIIDICAGHSLASQLK